MQNTRFVRLVAMLLFALGTLTTVMPGAAPIAGIKLTPLEDRVRVAIDGSLFTEYIFTGAPKPYFFPVLAADGTGLSRAFPMADVEGEARDHRHHRSLWFGHGSVNGHDFWLENDTSGTITQDSIETGMNGSTATIAARNTWRAHDGTIVCSDERVIGIRAVPGGRLLEFAITIHADHGPVTFGDTKEGTMSFRVAQWMVHSTRANRETVPGQGTILNSNGITNGDAWGQRATWVDYYAPHDGRIHGVAIFDHPSNPRHPTWWHVRDYGLFAANPFGKHDFERLREQPHAGDFVIPSGDSATFRYCFYFHHGDPETAQVAAHYQEYATKPLKP